MKKKRIVLVVLLLAMVEAIFSLDFVFNGFHHSNVSVYGNATVESRLLTLTNATTFSIGRALYPTRIPMRDPNSSLILPFSTSFIFAMAPSSNRLPGHGIVFLFAPSTGVDGASSAQHLGLFNRTNDGVSTNQVLGVEFDVFENQEFSDIDANHVGIDVNSLTSVASHTAGYWRPQSQTFASFEELQLNNGRNYQVWIDYRDFRINVTMALAGVAKPMQPLLNYSLNLSQVFQDEMYVGFTAATGALIQSHIILGWSFSNSNFTLSDELITTGLPSFELPTPSIFQSPGFIAGITVGLFCLLVTCVAFALFFIKRKMKRDKARGEMEDWELEYWPHRMTYKEIQSATNGFSEENVIGFGGNGKVYKGVLGGGGGEVAVKRISHDNNQGMREFLAEVSSLGRLKHRNLVGLRGWCKNHKGSLILVYDYMENGSLDKWVLDCDKSKMLGCQDRIRILKDVAVGVFYLHEGWEDKVLHRDIKASNVLLDKDMNGKLGDFGLARMHAHGQVATTTRVVGTVGYLAPEVIQTGRATTQTDVFSFGVLILEVMCGKRPIVEGEKSLVEWVWELMGSGELVNALDERLKGRGEFDEAEVEKVLHLGLLCAYPDPSGRPTMRKVVKALEGKKGVDESQGEEMDAYLLDKMKTKEMWSDYPKSLSYESHPKFDEIRKDLSTSMYISSSDIVEGR